MNKREIAMLGKVYEREVYSALNKSPCVYQTRSKIAKKLLDDGLLQTFTDINGGFRWTGYVLTHLGRLSYCMTCTEAEPESKGAK